MYFCKTHTQNYNIMKLTITPTKKTTNSKKQIVDLKNYLQKKGIKINTIETKSKKGELGGGLLNGVSTVLTGSGDTIFTKLGDALVKYVEGRRVDLTMKNNRGEELILSASIPKSEIRSLINEFFERKIARQPQKKVKKSPKKTEKDSKKTKDTGKPKATTSAAKKKVSSTSTIKKSSPKTKTKTTKK